MITEPMLMLLLGAVGVLGLALAWLAFSGALSAGARLAAVVLVVALAGVAYAAGERVLGNARPVGFEVMRPADEVQVLYAQAVRDQGIYLLVAAGAVPTYYRLPWDEETAKELRQALEESHEKQTPLMFRFEPSLEDRERKFYALPQQKLPDKPAPEKGFEYRNPEWGI